MLSNRKFKSMLSDLIPDIQYAIQQKLYIVKKEMDDKICRDRLLYQMKSPYFDWYREGGSYTCFRPVGYVWYISDKINNTIGNTDWLDKKIPKPDQIQLKKKGNKLILPFLN